MGTRRFKTRAEARAWLVPDAIEHAVAPFEGVWGEPAVRELRAFLERACATHPRLRTFATRAADALVEIDEAARLLKAAAKNDDEPRAPIAVRPAVPELPYEGAPDLAKPALYATTMRIIKSLANDFAKGSGYDFNDLVGIGWVVAVEIAPKWDKTKAAYETYLWRCVEGRMRDAVMKSSHRFEKPSGGIHCDDLRDDKKTKDHEGFFRRAVDATATSFVLVRAFAPNQPDDDASTRELVGRLRAAMDSLREEKRALIEKIYFRGETLDSARLELGLKDSTARLMHQQALLELRAFLEGSTNLITLRPKSRTA
jgi:RNA polymerase sigma factor (sigma-70 family)